jgi:Putative addiction module component
LNTAPNNLLFVASADKKPELEIDKLWAKEAEERLAAYRLGEIKTLDLNQVLTKYQLPVK